VIWAFLPFLPVTWELGRPLSQALQRLHASDHPLGLNKTRSNSETRWDLGTCTCVPALHDLGVRDLQSVPSPLITTRHRRAARDGAAATAAATRGARVAGESLRRVDAPTPRSCSARHLSQRSKVIATTSSGKSPCSPYRGRVDIVISADIFFFLR